MIADAEEKGLITPGKVTNGLIGDHNSYLEIEMCDMLFN